jgi:hypothetical protein
MLSVLFEINLKEILSNNHLHVQIASSVDESSMNGAEKTPD